MGPDQPGLGGNGPGADGPGADGPGANGTEKTGPDEATSALQRSIDLRDQGAHVSSRSAPSGEPAVEVSVSALAGFPRQRRRI